MLSLPNLVVRFLQHSSIEDKVALIGFNARDLTKDLKSPQQVISFTTAINLTAEQFDTVNETEICVNDTYNYEITFFANEKSIDCPFIF